MLRLDGDVGGALEVFDTAVGLVGGRIERLDEFVKVAHTTLAIDLEQLGDAVAELWIVDGGDGALGTDGHGAYAGVGSADGIADAGE